VAKKPGVCRAFLRLKDGYPPGLRYLAITGENTKSALGIACIQGVTGLNRGVYWTASTRTILHWRDLPSLVLISPLLPSIL